MLNHSLPRQGHQKQQRAATTGTAEENGIGKDNSVSMEVGTGGNESSSNNNVYSGPVAAQTAPPVAAPRKTMSLLAKDGPLRRSFHQRGRRALRQIGAKLIRNNNSNIGQCLVAIMTISIIIIIIILVVICPVIMAIRDTVQRRHLMLEVDVVAVAVVHEQT